MRNLPHSPRRSTPDLERVRTPKDRTPRTHVLRVVRRVTSSRGCRVLRPDPTPRASLRTEILPPTPGASPVTGMKSQREAPSLSIVLAQSITRLEISTNIRHSVAD